MNSIAINILYTKSAATTTTLTYGLEQKCNLKIFSTTMYLDLCALQTVLNRLNVSIAFNKVNETSIKELSDYYEAARASCVVNLWRQKFWIFFLHVVTSCRNKIRVPSRGTVAIIRNMILTSIFSIEGSKHLNSASIFLRTWLKTEAYNKKSTTHTAS